MLTCLSLPRTRLLGCARRFGCGQSSSSSRQLHLSNSPHHRHASQGLTGQGTSLSTALAPDPSLNEQELRQTAPSQSSSALCRQDELSSAGEQPVWHSRVLVRFMWLRSMLYQLIKRLQGPEIRAVSTTQLSCPTFSLKLGNAAREDEFDWFKKFTDIADLLRAEISSREARICMLGCGNSSELSLWPPWHSADSITMQRSRRTCMTMATRP